MHKTSLVLCGIAGGLSAYFGGLGAIVALVIGQIGISLTFINKLEN